MSLHTNRSTLALLALAVSAFAIGTTEFISVGLLPLVSQDLGVSITTAGLTVSLYALGVTFGAPVLTTLTSGMSRKSLLLWIMVIFILGNSIAASATSIGVLLLGRVVSALAHGVFMSIGSYFGGVVTDSIGLRHTPWIGALMVLGAVVLTAWCRALERKSQLSQLTTN